LEKVTREADQKAATTAQQAKKALQGNGPEAEKQAKQAKQAAQKVCFLSILQLPVCYKQRP
jgi:hypothetical protein